MLDGVLVCDVRCTFEINRELITMTVIFIQFILGHAIQQACYPKNVERFRATLRNWSYCNFVVA